MTRLITLAIASLALTSAAANAQTARENFSYSAPSGSFGDGMFKWNMYRQMHEDREFRERLRAGDDTPTGSIQGSATNDQTLRRPGETGSRRMRNR